MILESYQFEKYKADMREKIIEVSKQDHTIHGYMVYQCEHCNVIYVMWLEKGLADPTDDEKTGMHKPVPYGFICPACGGMAVHTLWHLGEDSLGKNYKSYQKYVEQPNRLIYRNFFWNDPMIDCGVPIILEPDYFPEKIGRSTYYISEIYINTLPGIECEDFIIFMKDGLCSTNPLILDEMLAVTITHVDPDEVILEGKANREHRRHGAFGKDGYKRPRSNKKLYEY